MSKVLYEKVINNKLAQIILEEDNITVSIIYDNNLIEVINSLDLGTEEDWVKEFILVSSVNTVIKNSSLDDLELD